ncbi:MAG: hypothetical protein Ta2A_25720 [Treponemataceae bacterium]|nr:MAG: hypothetical protein Ta2A_25720 [Treponemataceae bacterium]
MPYLTDTDGAFICAYDDAQSLEAKCAYILQRGGRGAMYWEYACDDEAGTLRTCVYRAILATSVSPEFA